MRIMVMTLCLCLGAAMAGQAAVLKLTDGRYVDQASVLVNRRGLIEIERAGARYFIPSREIVLVLEDLPAGATALTGPELAAFLPAAEAAAEPEAAGIAETAGEEAEEAAAEPERATDKAGTGSPEELQSLVGKRISWMGSGARDEQSYQLLARLSPEQARELRLKEKLYPEESFVVSGVRKLAAAGGILYRVDLYKLTNGRHYDLLLENPRELNGWQIRRPETPKPEPGKSPAWAPEPFPRAYLFTDASVSQSTVTYRQFSYYYSPWSYDYSVYAAVLGLGVLFPLGGSPVMGASFYLQTGLAVTGNSEGSSVPTGNQTQAGIEFFTPNRRFDMKLYGVYEYLVDADYDVSSIGGRLQARVMLY